jgi:hypothetical protein
MYGDDFEQAHMCCRLTVARQGVNASRRHFQKYIKIGEVRKFTLFLEFMLDHGEPGYLNML